MSAIERALSLPQRTLTKWKNGVIKPSAAGLALMKYIRTFPWLIEVAENNFEYNIAQKIYISSAIQIFLNSLNFDTKDFSEAGIIATSQSTFLYMKYDQMQSKDVKDEVQINVIGTDMPYQVTTQ